MPTIYRPPKKKKTYNSDRRKERQMIYNTDRWRKLRASYLMNHPLCERCQSQGTVREASDVHHKVSFMSTDDQIERESLAYDYDNLESLCRECHNEIHNKKKHDH